MRRYTVLLGKAASKELKRLPAAEANKLFKSIARLAEDPRPTGCKKLKGYQNAWRIRRGNYRILYTINDTEIVVEVLSVAHRKDAYR